MVTGYWLYNTWDKRFGHIPLPNATESTIELHGEIGGLFIGLCALFVAYSLFAGRRRLVQTKSLQQLGKVGHPIWWYSLHRVVNTGLLIMGLLIIVSGDALHDDVLEDGTFTDLAYTLHLSAWAGMVLLTLAHVGLSLKVGGMPLVLSMVNTRVRSSDRPTRWPERFLTWTHQSWRSVRTGV